MLYRKALLLFFKAGGFSGANEVFSRAWNPL
jgi:hypothetical protein